MELPWIISASHQKKQREPISHTLPGRARTQSHVFHSHQKSKNRFWSANESTHPICRIHSHRQCHKCDSYRERNVRSILRDTAVGFFFFFFFWHTFHFLFSRSARRRTGDWTFPPPDRMYINPGRKTWLFLFWASSYNEIYRRGR